MIRLRSFAATARQARGFAGFATAGVLMFAGRASLLACPVCFGAEETSVVQGTRLGVLVMLGIVLAVQGGFVAFFLYLRKHYKQNADRELDREWSQLQRTPETS